MNAHTLLPADQWLKAQQLSPIEVDCVTTLMLKIIDGKCKMNSQDKTLISELYQLTQIQSGILFDDTYHQLIASALTLTSEELVDNVYEKRVLAETQISRPVMKAFKKRLRDTNFLPAINK